LRAASATRSCSQRRCGDRWAKIPNQRGVSRCWIIQEVENSLRRLGTDWIDLYQIHRYEPDVDIEETLSALNDLVHQGKVRYIGSSTFPASAIVDAQCTARDRHLQRYVCEQPPYSMLARGIEADVLPTCQHYDEANRTDNNEDLEEGADHSGQRLDGRAASEAHPRLQGTPGRPLKRRSDKRLP